MKGSHLTSVLDHAPLGWFYVWHLVRQIFAWAAIASAPEATPYMFPAMQAQFRVGTEEMAVFAASWPVGNLLGTAVCVFALDTYGRRPCMIAASAGTALLGASICMDELTLNQVILLRAVQGVFWSIAITACQTWYAEFLPTNGRGALLAAPCIGWPLGRGLVIITAGAMGDHNWKAVAGVSVALFGVTFLWWLATAPESPRYLAINGREKEARVVIEGIYTQNGRADMIADIFDLERQVEVPLTTSSTTDTHRDRWQHGSSESSTVGSTGAGNHADSRADSYADRGVQKADEHPDTFSRLRQLLLVHPSLFAFISALYCALAIVFALLDTWGPRLFGQLFAGGGISTMDTPSLPHQTMLLFNAGDLCGIIVSILIQDKVSCDCFYIV
jgi:MFS family permease